jgi:hypothetical protein
MELDLKTLQKYQLLQLPNELEETQETNKKTCFSKSKKLNQSFFSTKASQNAVAKDVDLILKDEKEQQEHLTEMLSIQSQKLLKQTIQFSKTLQQEESVRNDLEQRILNNSLLIENERKQMGLISHKTWTTTLLVWLSVLVCLILFAWAILYMRLFSPVNIYKIKTTAEDSVVPRIIKDQGNTKTGNYLKTVDTNHDDEL